MIFTTVQVKKKSRISTNSFITLASTIAPIFAGIISTRLLLTKVGNEVYAYVAYAWLILGLINYLDLGVLKHLTFSLSQALPDTDFRKISHIITSSNFTIVIYGILFSIIFQLIGIVLMPAWHLKTEELILAITISALCIPCTLIINSYKSIFECIHEYKWSCTIKSIYTAGNYLTPLLIIFDLSDAVVIVSGSFLLNRLITISMFHILFDRTFRGVIKFYPPLTSFQQLTFSSFRLTRFSFWYSVSYVLSNILGVVDRFLIPLNLPLSFLPYYSTPLDLITKLWLVPNAINTSIYPSVVQDFMLSNHNNYLKTLRKGCYAVSFSVLPISFILFFFGETLLSFWIDKSFAAYAATSLRILSVFIPLSCVAQLPHSFLVAFGSPRSSAIIQLVQLPVFAISITSLVKVYGIAGAAYAWCIKVVLDAFLCFSEFYSLTKLTISAKDLIPLTFTILSWLIAFIIDSTGSIPFQCVFVAGFSLLSCYVLLQSQKSDQLKFI